MILVYDKFHGYKYVPSLAEREPVNNVIRIILENSDLFNPYTVDLCETLKTLMAYNHPWTRAQAVYFANILRQAGVGDLTIEEKHPGELMTELFSGVSLPKKDSEPNVLKFGQKLTK